jgi:hypothetical protein
VPANDDVRVEIDWNRNGGTPELEPLIRWAAGNNFYRLTAQTGVDTITLNKMVAGVSTNLAVYPWPWSLLSKVRVAIQAYGTAISATINGVDQTPVVDASHATGGWGLQYTANADVTPTTGINVQTFRAWSRVP